MGMKETYAYAIQTVKGRFHGASAAAALSSPRTYTVKAGDTLAGIAQAHLGSAAAYMKIFEVNQDQLTDPDQITPGQVLNLP